LRFVVDGAEGVEELVGGDDLALQQDRSYYGGGRPVPGARWHFKEPLLKGELTKLAHAAVMAKYCGHVVFLVKLRVEGGGAQRKRLRARLVGRRSVAVSYHDRSK